MSVSGDVGENKVSLHTDAVRVLVPATSANLGPAFDSAGLAEVGEHRLFIGALLGPASQLAHRHHRTLKLLGPQLELTGEFRDFLLA